MSWSSLRPQVGVEYAGRLPDKELLCDSDPAALGLCENSEAGERASKGGMPVLYPPAPFGPRIVQTQEVNGHLPDEDVAPEHCPES